MCTEINEFEKNVLRKPNFSFHHESKFVSEASKLSLFTKIACLLEKLISMEKELKQKNFDNNFDVDYLPTITILDYLKRLDLYLKFNEEFYYTALIYIDRFIDKNKFHLSDSNVYK